MCRQWHSFGPEVPPPPKASSLGFRKQIISGSPKCIHSLGADRALYGVHAPLRVCLHGDLRLDGNKDKVCTDVNQATFPYVSNVSISDASSPLKALCLSSNGRCLEAELLNYVTAASGVCSRSPADPSRPLTELKMQSLSLNPAMLQ